MTTVKLHARLGASNSYCWSSCTAAPGEWDRLEAELLAANDQAREAAAQNSALFGMEFEPDVELGDDSNEASRWGTAAHLVGETCLNNGAEPEDYLGRWVYIPKAGGEVIVDKMPIEVLFGNGHAIEIDDDVVDCATTYVKFVRGLVHDHNAVLLVEQRVSIQHITGEEGAGGTSDSVLYFPHQRELCIADLKGGMVRVDAFTTREVRDPFLGTVTPVDEPNTQLAMYADGALEELGWMFGPIERVRLIIVQPRLDHISEISLTVPQLKECIAKLRAAAEETRINPQFRPGPKTCKFCPAAGTCKAMRQAALQACLTDFEDLENAQPKPVQDDTIGIDYEALPLVKMWAKGVQERMHFLLSRGVPVIGNQGEYMLAEGKAGRRYWKDEAKVEHALRQTFRLPEEKVFKKTLISPAQAEALKKRKRGSEEKPLIGETQWNRLSEEIGQNPGKPTVALKSSGKKAAQPATAGFENLEPEN